MILNCYIYKRDYSLKSDISFSKILQSTTENTRQAGSSEMTQRICSAAFKNTLLNLKIQLKKFQAEGEIFIRITVIFHYYL